MFRFDLCRRLEKSHTPQFIRRKDECPDLCFGPIIETTNLNRSFQGKFILKEGILKRMHETCMATWPKKI